MEKTTHSTKPVAPRILAKLTGKTSPKGKEYNIWMVRAHLYARTYDPFIEVAKREVERELQEANNAIQEAINALQ